MSSVKIEKGLLSGQELRPNDPEELRQFAQTESIELDHVSFYKKALSHVTFRGVTFRACSLAQSSFEHVNFRKCKFDQVDLTRTRFANCYFSDCSFIDCDPYNALFPDSVVDPSAFKKCYTSNKDLNKALLLFSGLKRDLQAAGNSRASRAADYYYSKWERRLLYHRWRFRQMSGARPWLWSLILGSLTGYGERPIYLLFWMFSMITGMGVVYKTYFPFSLSPGNYDFWSYWYFSFKIFCAKGFTNDVLSGGLLFCQVAEFTFGLILLALLIGSVTRKLS
jgi:hypothetical protein